MFRKFGLLLGLVLLITACETTPTQDGAVLGGLLGAGLGAVIGHQTGHGAEGALIGAGAGALTGGIIGNEVGETRQQARPVATQPAPQSRERVVTGHYETRIVRTPSGETYEERVWVPDP